MRGDMSAAGVGPSHGGAWRRACSRSRRLLAALLLIPWTALAQGTVDFGQIIAQAPECTLAQLNAGPPPTGACAALHPFDGEDIAVVTDALTSFADPVAGCNSANGGGTKKLVCKWSDKANDWIALGELQAVTPPNQNCAVGSVVTGIDASGNITCVSLPGGGDMLRSTYDADLDGEVTLAEAARALNADPVACSAGLLVRDIAADGTLTCVAPPAATHLDSGTTFPSSPTQGQVFVVVDDSAVGACDSGAGSAVSFCYWNGSAWVSPGRVTSFEGRVGAIVSVAGDYTATEITNTPAGAIGATNVQAALNELDSEKSATGHAHSGADITSGALALARLTDGGTAGVPLVAGGGGGDPSYAVLTATGIDATAIQRRVSGTCAAGSSIRVIAEDGTVTCESDDVGGGGGGYDAVQTDGSSVAKTGSEQLDLDGGFGIETSGTEGTPDRVTIAVTDSEIATQSELDTKNVESFPTAGGSGTAPVSGGAGTTSMTNIATQAELDAHAALPNAHHAQAHSLTGGDHTLAGATDGMVLQATGATTFEMDWPRVRSAADCTALTDGEANEACVNTTGARRVFVCRPTAGLCDTGAEWNPQEVLEQQVTFQTNDGARHQHVPADIEQGTASRCARFDATGILVPAAGDCANGDTGGAGGSAQGGVGDVQYGGAVAGNFDAEGAFDYDEANNHLTLGTWSATTPEQGRLTVVPPTSGTVGGTLTLYETTPGCSPNASTPANCQGIVLRAPQTVGTTRNVDLEDDATPLPGAMMGVGGDGSGTVAALVVTDDSHSHTGTTVSALDAGDTTTGTFADARVDGSAERDELFLEIDWNPSAGGTTTAGLREALFQCPVTGKCVVKARANTTYTLTAAPFTEVGGVANVCDCVDDDNCNNNSDTDDECSDIWIEGAPGAHLTFSGAVGTAVPNWPAMIGFRNTTRGGVRDLRMSVHDTCNTTDSCGCENNGCSAYMIILSDNADFIEISGNDCQNTITSDGADTDDWHSWRCVHLGGTSADKQPRLARVFNNHFDSSSIGVVYKSSNNGTGENSHDGPIISGNVFTSQNRPAGSNAPIKGHHIAALGMGAVIVGNQFDMRNAFQAGNPRMNAIDVAPDTVDTFDAAEGAFGWTIQGNVIRGLNTVTGGISVENGASSGTISGNYLQAGECSSGGTLQSCWEDADCPGVETCEPTFSYGLLIQLNSGDGVTATRGFSITNNVFGPGQNGDGGWDDASPTFFAPINIFDLDTTPADANEGADNVISGNVFHLVSSADDGFAMCSDGGGCSAPDEAAIEAWKDKNTIAGNVVWGANRGTWVSDSDILIRGERQLRFVDSTGDDACIAPDTAGRLFHNDDCDDPPVKDAAERFLAVGPGEITGDDVAASIAGAGLSLTAGSPDTIDVNPGLGLTITSDALGIDQSASLSGDHTISANQWKGALNGLIFEGSSADAIETYVSVVNPTTSDRTFTIPNANSVAVQAVDCGAGNKIQGIDANGVIDCDPDAGGASATAIDALADPGAGDGIVDLAELPQIWTWDTAATAASFNGLELAINNDATAGSTTQRVLRISRQNTSGSQTMQALLRLDNLDGDGTVTSGIVVASATNTLIATGIDVADAELNTAIAIGTNDVTVNGLTLSAAELGVLDSEIALGTETSGNYAGSSSEGGAATSAETGDSATAFFSTGQIGLAQGGTGADASGYTAGLLGLSGGALQDTDTEAELETAIGSVDLVAIVTDDVTSANLRTALSDESGTGAALFAGGAIGAATATSPAVNDDDTSVPTTEWVQDESVAAGDVTGTIGTGLTIGDNAVQADDLEVMATYETILSGSLSSDGTSTGAECSAPTEVADIGGTDGMKRWTIVCPLGGTNQDGLILGSYHLGPDYVAGTAIAIEATWGIHDDPGATEVIQGVINARCLSDGDAGSTTWTANAGLDVTFVSGDVQWDTHKISASVTPDGSCAAGDTLEFRYVVCDTGTPPTTGCAASTHDVVNSHLYGLRLGIQLNPAAAP